MRLKELEKDLLQIPLGYSLFVKTTGQEKAFRAVIYRINKKNNIHLACYVTNHHNVFNIVNETEKWK